MLIPGGPAAVSTTVEQQIDALGITTLRFAGTDRTDTAALVATFETTLASAAPQSGLAYSTAAVDLVRGDTFADALTVPGYAWSIGTGTPLLMAINPDNLGAATAAYLKRTGAASPMPGLGTGTINVFGGPGALEHGRRRGGGRRPRRGVGQRPAGAAVGRSGGVEILLVGVLLIAHPFGLQDQLLPLDTGRRG